MDQIEDASVDVDKFGEEGLSGEGELSLPQQLEDMIEDSVENRDWEADDPPIHVMWK